MNINVKWFDIRHGLSARGTECMVALALKRELRVSYASIGYEGGKILTGGELVDVYLPQAVRNKIRFWDRFHIMVPFSFELATAGFLTGSGLEVATKPEPARRKEVFVKGWANG